MDRVRQAAVQPSSPHDGKSRAHSRFHSAPPQHNLCSGCMYFCGMARTAHALAGRCDDVCRRLLSQIFSARLTCVLTASIFYNQSTELSPQAVSDRLSSLQALLLVAIPSRLPRCFPPVLEHICVK